MPSTYYKVATKKHEALLELNNPYVMRSKEFDSYDDALAYAQNTFSSYEFIILEIKPVYHSNKPN